MATADEKMGEAEGGRGRRRARRRVEFVCPHLDGRGDAADATPLALLLLLLSSSSSAIAEVDVVGGVTSSVDADLDVVPATNHRPKVRFYRALIII